MARGKVSKRSDEERLRHFVAVVDSCVERRAIREGTLRASLTISGILDQAPEIEADNGDEEDVRSLMLDVRKFLANDDDAHFYSICNIIEHRVTDPEVLNNNRFNRETWKTSLQGQINLIHQGRELRGRELLDVWINGVVFHSDAEAAQRYHQLDSISRAMFAQEVNGMIIECIYTVLAEANLIRAILERGLLNADVD